MVQKIYSQQVALIPVIINTGICQILKIYSFPHLLEMEPNFKFKKC